MNIVKIKCSRKFHDLQYITSKKLHKQVTNVNKLLFTVLSPIIACKVAKVQGSYMNT